MRKYRFSSKASDPRVLCVTNRDIAPVISRCSQYEFEDLIGGIDAVDVVAPADTPAPTEGVTPAQKGFRTLRRLAAKAGRRLALNLEAAAPVTGRRRPPAGLAPHYDMLFVYTETALDLYNLGPCEMWRSTADVSICHIQELYAPDIASLGGLLQILARFDYITVSNRGTVEPLAEATGRPCYQLIPSVDALKFCPYPGVPDRVIDFYALGRRPPPATHEALLRLADRDGRYYVYDTVTNCPVSSHAEHRIRLAENIQRSRFFLVNTAAYTELQRTGGQQELGYRYFEGAAGGAVLIGDMPENESSTEHFGWPDAVIPLPPDRDIADIIAELEADPRRLERISATNVINSLRRHDHLYRWGEILSIAGLEETAAMERRRRDLEELAVTIERNTLVAPK
ncbi:glycosyltransferase family 1 protein [Mycolicibacterium flavescens]|uniref:Spore protein YkvP/CgeB glycosyl transferase-like domain-containing protein n=1 Tax=Mycolicibacterium flavescens TaxID=1776 RepID=A0A1E3RK13_MYCFV|nr:hypothetical protein [Mycolicibacterium flavescens]MCV7282571.1 glycosyltransferase family 1 protein [Mycolicibacterium flavescens]ODQ90194.1 hypothetical protein BHQ18_12240 [Mycolicibacterium flavescens]